MDDANGRTHVESEAARRRLDWIGRQQYDLELFERAAIPVRRAARGDRDPGNRGNLRGGVGVPRPPAGLGENGERQEPAAESHETRSDGGRERGSPPPYLRSRLVLPHAPNHIGGKR